jgi:type IX secretion system PorP/SprF family membrane protein
MKTRFLQLLVLVVLALPIVTKGQSDPHYTMFMFNKLIYNPGYAGSRDVTSLNGTYRDQWDGIDGAPKTFNVSIDGPVGSYMQPFRRVALGLLVNSETAGVLTTTNVLGYYAYRIPLKHSVLSLGLQGGAAIYNAAYNKLNPFQNNDQSLTNPVKNAFLPNFGAGAYWYGDKFYAGFSVPNLLENYYDKSGPHLNNEASKQIRSYYLCGGYVFDASEIWKIEPQALVRYAGDGTYKLPMTSDFNLSFIAYDRLLFGVTYRTDNSFEGIVHLQVTKMLNIGYAYDYTNTLLNMYSKGSHEVTVGFDFIRDKNAYANPRFVKMF